MTGRDCTFIRCGRSTETLKHVLNGARFTPTCSKLLNTSRAQGVSRTSSLLAAAGQATYLVQLWPAGFSSGARNSWRVTLWGAARPQGSKQVLVQASGSVLLIKAASDQRGMVSRRESRQRRQQVCTAVTQDGIRIQEEGRSSKACSSDVLQSGTYGHMVVRFAGKDTWGRWRRP